MTSVWRSLSGRLLLLTVLFVMIAELLIFIPSVARYRLDYLGERVEMGQLVGLAAAAADRELLTEDFRDELLRNAEVLMVAMKRGGTRSLLIGGSVPGMADTVYDLRDATIFSSIWDSAMLMWTPSDRLIRVIGRPRFGGAEWIEVVVEERLLRAALSDFAVRIFWLSLFISAVTAGLVFLAVQLFLVAPIQGLIRGVVTFREDPEDADRIITPSGARGEVGEAERELAETQREVRAALRQKTRLAALGEAVAKINHDLRNMLASAQLMADRLETSRDPMVARVTPKLLGSLDRAIRLCTQTLAYGRADEAPPNREVIRLDAMLDDLKAALGLAEPRAVGEAGALRFENRAPEDFTFVADPDQVFRALLNLARNAVQAIETHRGAAGVIAVEARRAPGVGAEASIEIDLVDDGPGLPKQARLDLFKPFKGSASRGGTGLGVAIAAELVKGHGGALALVESSEAGTRFRITLPQQAQRAAA